MYNILRKRIIQTVHLELIPTYAQDENASHLELYAFQYLLSRNSKSNTLNWKSKSCHFNMSFFFFQVRT